MTKISLFVALICALCGAAAPALADSLYNPQTYRSLVADRKAMRPGDKLTVLIVENTSAQTTANTQTEKSALPSLRLRLPNTSHDSFIGLSEQFEGSGRTDRGGRLLGTITVVVESIDPNGDLNVRGEQFIEINDEKQAIKLEGSVRPDDLRENNTVLSSRIANARISYVGEGVLGSRQTPGLLSLIFSLLGLL